MRKSSCSSNQTYHSYNLVVEWLGDDAAVGGYVLDHLGERVPLDLLPLEVGERLGREVEYGAALGELLHEELLALGRRRVLEHGQLLQLAVLADVEAGRALLARLARRHRRIHLDLVDRRGGRVRLRVGGGLGARLQLLVVVGEIVVDVFELLFLLVLFFVVVVLALFFVFFLE